MLKKIILPMMLCASLNSCSVFTPVQLPEVHTYQISGIDDPSVNSCSNSLKPSILQVSLMKTDAPYDSNQMFYSRGAFELNAYSYHKWISSPNIMLSQAMQERLLAACIYTNVVNSEFMTIAQYRLATQLLELKQVMESSTLSKTSTVHFVVIAQLIDNHTNQVIKSKTFVEDASVASDPSGYVAGTNQVTKAFLDDLVAWLK